MTIPDNVSDRIEYIQKLFLRVATCVEAMNDISAVIEFLEQEEAEFRSIAYESASMTIGVRDLRNTSDLQNWEQFRNASLDRHSFHVDIGLGWSFAKTGIQPNKFLRSGEPVKNRMVYDGFGYYYGLFKGRSVIKNRAIPAEVEDIIGFDQGLGRRLWYLAKGNVEDLIEIVKGFDEVREPALWRGVGIACGYVGGIQGGALARLSNAAAGYKKQLESGIGLAAISRIASNSVSEDVSKALLMICGKTIEELKEGSKVADEFYYL
jgi:hypothetical protein